MSGRKYVMSADRSQVSNFRGNFLFGFLSCGPAKVSPGPIYSMICPTSDTYNKKTGRMILAPLGLRRIQQSIENNYGSEAVVAQHPFQLEKTIDENTKVVGLTEMSPLGIGTVDTAISWNNDPWNRMWFTRLTKKLKKLKEKYGFKVAVGGPGSWQLLNPFTNYMRRQLTPLGRDASQYEEGSNGKGKSQTIDPWVKEELGVDHVIEGEADVTAPRIFEEIENGEAPEVIRSMTNSISDMDEIPEIKRGTLTGTLEIMRGCGRGCDFCAPNLRTKRDFPIERLVREAKVNLKLGQDAIWLLTEELTLYGCDNKDKVPNGDAIVGLFKALKEAGARRIGSTHWTFAGVRAAEETIHKLSQINELSPDEWMGVQPGLEWISPRLVKRYMPHKMKPFTPDEYPETIRKAIKIMNRNYYYPAITLVVGHPDEEPDEVDMTTDFINTISRKDKMKGIVAPLLYVDYYKPDRTMDYDMMTENHWKLYYTAWKHNAREFADSIWLATQSFNMISRLGTIMGTYAISGYILRFLKAQFKKRFGYIPNWMDSSDKVETPSSSSSNVSS